MMMGRYSMRDASPWVRFALTVFTVMVGTPLLAAVATEVIGGYLDVFTVAVAALVAAVASWVMFWRGSGRVGTPVVHH